MCSINGFSWQDETLVRRMNAVTAHRGPDGTGIYTAPQISLGHNRLAILDLSAAGAQPMQSASGRLVISFNGEIYNYRELAAELNGYPFKSKSDTEVILAAYETWGDDAFGKLQGMFSLALWDKETETIRLVRDPVGIKPLYYVEQDGRLIFSSEIKALLLHAELKRRIDPLSLDLYLRINYVPSPLTLFSGIRKLPPGAILVYRRGASALSSFVSFKAKPVVPLSRAALADELRARVRDSVKSQLVSDRPVGLYLSGGIDSSVVLEGMARSAKNPQTFSVGFELQPGEQREKFNADAALARKTALYFGATHHEVMLSPRDIVPLFEDALYHLDEPVSNPTVIPMLMLAKFAKERVSVVLAGDGGDELFGGYERYRLSRISSLYRTLPAWVRTLGRTFVGSLEKLDTTPGIERYARFHFLKEPTLRPLLQQSFYHAHAAEDFFSRRFLSGPSFESEPFESAFMRADRESWLVDEALLRSDKMSMAAALEVRVPLLHLPLIAFSDALPLRYKLSLRDTKIILKEAFQKELPVELLRQPKRGWFSPGAKWLRYPHVSAFAREALSPDYWTGTRAVFEWGEVRTRLERHLAGEYHFTELWALLTLQVWARRFKVFV